MDLESYAEPESDGFDYEFENIFDNPLQKKGVSTSERKDCSHQVNTCFSLMESEAEKNQGSTALLQKEEIEPAKSETHKSLMNEIVGIRKKKELLKKLSSKEPICSKNGRICDDEKELRTREIRKKSNRLLSDAFNALQEVIPQSKETRLTRAQTLILAKDYILNLTNVVYELKNKIFFYDLLTADYLKSLSCTQNGNQNKKQLSFGDGCM
ncbi:hypothetical protein CDAR_601351 [Caerostris darwini]|uniref:BHLH domain-containing protein n=1 Tax=Caerostris darwini TaxID=1538125 RepID=A0AAV4WUN8_9ARAC|nr:hypothetical protein CDAR_601351 [Caerostris darwini]